MTTQPTPKHSRPNAEARTETIELPRILMPQLDPDAPRRKPSTFHSDFTLKVLALVLILAFLVALALDAWVF